MSEKELEEYFGQGHFDIKTPDGASDDYDISVPMFITKRLNHGTYQDSNGSEVLEWTQKGDVLTLRIVYHEHKFSRCEWPEEVEIVLAGKIEGRVFVATDVVWPDTLKEV